MKYTEYRVEELSSVGDWYRHGYQGDNLATATQSLKRMQATYAQYGRTFRLVCRHLSEWKEKTV